MYAFVISPAVVSVNDIPVTLAVGDVFPSDDTVVVNHPALFSDAPSVLRQTVPAKKRAAKKAAARKSDD